MCAKKLLYSLNKSCFINQQNSAQSDEIFDSIVLSSSSVNVESTSKLNESSDFILDESLILQKQPFLTESSITDEIVEANKLYEEKKYSESLLIYDAVLINDPFNIYALNGKGGTQLFLKQFDESIETFEYILQFYPDNINALNGKAYAYYLKSISMKSPVILYDSIHAYQDALKMDPNNIDALVGIASALDGLERYEEATDYYDQVLFLDPTNDTVQDDLFSLLMKLGNYEAQFFYFDSAIAYFDKVLERDPNNLPALLAKAASYAEWAKLNEKYYEFSKNVYIEILEKYPDNISALNGMGYILSEQLQFEKSLYYYERSLEVDSDNIDAKSGKSFVVNRLNDT